MSGAICNPLCVKHDAIRPCPVCDKKEFEQEMKRWKKGELV